MMHEILRPGVSCYETGEVSNTGLLIDGSDYYRAFCAAAETAEHFILLSGWQFDSDAQLLRDEGAGEEYALIAFLNRLCERKKDLRIYILAWNFSVIYCVDREWLQSWYFKWSAHERIQFCFDSCHPFGASHHQKYVVIDGRIAFLGGLDICSGRWDERDHQAVNPRRVNADRSPYPPFHDVQSYHFGGVAQSLTKLFKEQWRAVCNCELDLPLAGYEPVVDLKNGLPINSNRVAISRTQVKPTETGYQSVREIRRLFRDAIAAAESLVYIENQYFSSQAIYDALARRMADRRRSRLEIILVLAKEANAFVEQASIGIAQAKIIRDLKQLAAETGHRLGVYYPATSSPDGTEVPIYIHSKLLLIDDRFLSVGSANMNNRSMGLDTELNVSWQARPNEAHTLESIRDVRVDLLAEHTGLFGDHRVDLDRTSGLVNVLDQFASDAACRLRCHPLVEASTTNGTWIETVFPEGLPLDPEGPIFGEDTYEPLGDRDTFFPKGISWLSTLLSKGVE
jgi:phosphatidylserine/phosphatidylglycerophosphate/cardiolipin synthase-like enzyme